LFIGDLHALLGFKKEAAALPFDFREPISSFRARLTFSATTHERAPPGTPYVWGTARTSLHAGRSIRPRYSIRGGSMDGLEVIFLMCAVVWLYALLEYF